VPQQTNRTNGHWPPPGEEPDPHDESRGWKPRSKSDRRRSERRRKVIVVSKIAAAGGGPTIILPLLRGSIPPTPPSWSISDRGRARRPRRTLGLTWTTTAGQLADAVKEAGRAAPPIGTISLTVVGDEPSRHRTVRHQADSMTSAQQQAMDRRMMTHAIGLSKQSGKAGEYPYAAVVCRDGAIVAESINRVVHDGDVTRHAEVVAISLAQKALRSVSLDDCEIFVKCRSPARSVAMQSASRIRRVVFGLSSPHMGGVSKWNVLADNGLNAAMPEVFSPPPEIISGFMAKKPSRRRSNGTHSSPRSSGGAALARRRGDHAHAGRCRSSVLFARAGFAFPAAELLRLFGTAPLAVMSRSHGAATSRPRFLEPIARHDRLGVREAMRRKAHQEIVKHHGQEPDVLVLCGDTAAFGDAAPSDTSAQNRKMRSLDPPGETKKSAIGSTRSTAKPASSRISRRIASPASRLVDHASHDSLQPAAGLRERRIHELLDQI
jgi:tRNA(adenine34) deaminase